MGCGATRRTVIQQEGVVHVGYNFLMAFFSRLTRRCIHTSVKLHRSCASFLTATYSYLKQLPCFFGWFPTKNMQTPSSLKSGYLDIKDAQCAENKVGRKISYNIISCLGALGVQKRPFGHPKIQFSSKVFKFAGKIGIDLTLIFLHKRFFFV